MSDTLQTLPGWTLNTPRRRGLCSATLPTPSPTALQRGVLCSLSTAMREASHVFVLLSGTCSVMLTGKKSNETRDKKVFWKTQSPIRTHRFSPASTPKASYCGPQDLFQGAPNRPSSPTACVSLEQMDTVSAKMCYSLLPFGGFSPLHFVSYFRYTPPSDTHTHTHTHHLILLIRI